MSRHMQQPEEPPPGYVNGSDISLEEWHEWNLAMDYHGDLHCYLGYRPPQRHGGIYGVGVAAHYPEGRTSFRFVRLSRGSLSYASFFSDSAYYKVLRDRKVVLPGVADFYFGVVNDVDSTEDRELTRALFGATAGELQLAVQSFASVIGKGLPSYPIGLGPRVTFSGQRDNRCDIAYCLIPRNFPYVCLTESQYLWGHISLSGFYRLLALMAEGAGVVRSALLDAGLSEESLKRLITCGFNQYQYTTLLMDERDM